MANERRTSLFPDSGHGVIAFKIRVVCRIRNLRSLFTRLLVERAGRRVGRGPFRRAFDAARAGTIEHSNHGFSLQQQSDECDG